MNLDTFFKKFELFADAPDAVARMRQVIVSLATSGKLIRQVSGDLPAVTLLPIAEGERKSLEKKKLIPKQKRQQPVAMNEAPFEVPENWCWTRLGTVGVVFNGNSINAEEKERNYMGVEGRPYIATKDVGYGYEALSYENGVRIPYSETKFKLAKRDSVLICAEGGSAGRKSGITDRDICFGNKLFCNQPLASICAKYILFWYLSSRFIELFDTVKTGIIGGVSIAKFIELPFPLPPLAEQKRIVAKVDELMALCDQLEAQQRERDKLHTSLSRASLARFSEKPTTANLNLIFHKSYNIPPADLRKTILTLAVQGKLVPQDPRDEPAEALLTRLTNELISKNRRNEAHPFSTPQTGSLQFDLPCNWKWALFCEVAIIASNLVKPTDFPDFIHLAPDNIEKGNGVLLHCSTVREDKVISSNHRFYSGQIVYSKIRPNLAKVVVVDFDGLCSADMYPIDALIDVSYLHRYMLSEAFLVQAVKTDTRVAMPKINQMELNAIAVPVPPLAEQRRIVAKVDQLMALVDEMERQIGASREKAMDLLQAITAGFNAPIHMQNGHTGQP